MISGFINRSGRNIVVIHRLFDVKITKFLSLLTSTMSYKRGNNEMKFIVKPKRIVKLNAAICSSDCLLKCNRLGVFCPTK